MMAPMVDGEATGPELAVTGPGGWGLHVTGTLAAIVTIMAAIGGAIWWQNHEDHKVLLHNQQMLLTIQTAQLREHRVLNWLISQPFDQRPALPRPPEADDLLREVGPPRP